MHARGIDAPAAIAVIRAARPAVSCVYEASAGFFAS
jgi:hypothetical protein